jgi:NosR/NirI family transcriptional regulator, nitrous oxide reductase regulator
MAIGARRALWVIAIFLSLAVAWQIGWVRQQTDLKTSLASLLDPADEIIQIGEGLYQGVIQNGKETRLLSTVSLGTASGYAGPIQTAVAVNADGAIQKIAILRQTETLVFFRKLRVDALLDTLKGKVCTDPFAIGQDIQAVTGATISLEGLTDSIRQACYQAARQAQMPTPDIPFTKIRLGAPEGVLILLYVVGFLAYLPSQKLSKPLRTLGLILGFVLLGCWLNRPLSLVQINTFLLGTWPLWRTHLYWYLLVGGILLPVLLTGRSVYCSHICPLAAVQESLGALSGKRIVIPNKVNRWLHRGQRMLVWSAVVCALTLRNPSLITYEVTGTLFGLTGAFWQFGLLAVVLITSLFVARPWCNVLCPIRAVVDYLRLGAGKK